jgi:hypothetical protein
VKNKFQHLYKSNNDLNLWGQPLLASYYKVAKYLGMINFSFSKKKKILVYGTKIFNSLNKQNQENAHLILTAKDPVRMKNLPSSFNYNPRNYKHIYRYVFEKRNEELAHIQINIKKVFDKVLPELLVASSTIDPINQLYIEEAYKRNIKSICIQHGVFPINMNDKIFEDCVLEQNIVDKYLALDKSQVSELKKIFPSSKINLIGTPKSFIWTMRKKELNICFVGTDIERYGYKTLKQEALETFRQIRNYFRPIHQFYYKKHPSEKLETRCYKIISNQDLDKMDVFIGFNSTLLKDMSSRKKLSIQIFDKSFRCPNYQISNYSLAVKNGFGMFKDIEKLLKGPTVVPYILNKDINEFF